MIISIRANALKFGNPDKNEICRNFFVYEPILAFFSIQNVRNLITKSMEKILCQYLSNWKMKNRVKYIYKVKPPKCSMAIKLKTYHKIDLFDDIISM